MWKPILDKSIICFRGLEKGSEREVVPLPKEDEHDERRIRNPGYHGSYHDLDRRHDRDSRRVDVFHDVAIQVAGAPLQRRRRHSERAAGDLPPENFLTGPVGAELSAP